MKMPAFVVDLKSRAKVFLAQRENLTILMVVGGAFFVIAVVVLAFAHRPADPLAEVIPQPVEDSTIRHPLTGEVLEVPLENLPQVFGVMIENSADAWPLTGVNEAFLVIEAPVEGNIPRFITFFDAGTEVEKLGPVRSARPYYLDWASQFDNLIYAHVGGSPDALDRLRSGELPLLDLNEFFQGEHFYRDQRRYAPHNVYTDADRLGRAFAELEPVLPSYQPLVFKHDSPIDESARTSLTLDWGPGSTYDIKWEYDAVTNSYSRIQGGIDVSVSANNVIIFSTDIESIDNVDRKRITTVGQGSAMVFQDGGVVTGRWEKTSVTEPLRFVDDQGNVIAWNAGRTWIEVVRSLTAVSLEEAN